MSDLIVGRRAVLETLRARRRRPFRLWIEGNEGDALAPVVGEARAEALAAGVPVRFVRGGLFEKLAREVVNAQGLALEAGDYPYAGLDAIFALAKQRAEPPLLLILDHLQDPQNLGTLIRSAEAFGVHGILIPDRRAARVTAAVSNASAGAVEHMLVAQVTNLNRAIDDLKAAGIWVAGLDGGPGATPLARANLAGALALVVGSEGEGLSRLTREHCDFLVRIPMVGRVESLNAAIAGSIVLAAARQTRE